MLSHFKRIFSERFARRKSAPDAETPPEPTPPAEPTATPTRSAPDVASKISLGDIDPDAVKVVRRLTQQGHTAYLVGGCVRDLLLGRKPKDFDVSTSATPRDVKALFRNSRIIGRRFKLVHVFFRPPGGEGREKIIEVSTFRALQADNEDNPKDLLITRDNVFGTPAEDALRRDFTVNALFCDLEAREVIDHASGLPDLHRGVLRTIGDPDIRLREDPVRILRAIKFASRLGFRIERGTLDAMRNHRGDIPRCPPPRILEEILRILRSGAAVDAFALLGESRVLEVLLPEIDSALTQDLSRVDLYHGILAEFDRRAALGEALDTAVLLSSLFLPLMPWQGNSGAGGQDLPGAITKIFGPVATRLRVSRRDTDLVRRILLSIRKMVPGYRAKRFSRPALARREYFPQLLQVFDIHCRAQGRWQDTVRQWQDLSRQYPPDPPRDTPRRGSRRRGGHPRAAGGSPGGGEALSNPRSRRRGSGRGGRGTG